jgi:integrase
MPSLTKDSRGRSPYWFCCYTSATGQRLKKSTKQKDRKKAWEVCLAIENAEGYARNGTLTEQTAKKIIGEIFERTTGEPLQNFKTGEWFQHWLEIKDQVRSRKTTTRYRQVVRDFLASLGDRASLNLTHIASKDILAYRTSIIKAGKSARTANLSVKVISAGFNAALRQKHIASNPCTVLESLRVETQEKGTFSPAQISKLLKAAEGDWRGAILLGYYTGARLGDVANMLWNAVDLDEGVIRFIPSKTKKPVTVPLHTDLRRELLKRPGIGKAFLFPSLAGKGTGGRYGLSGRFAAIMERASIEGKTSRPATGGRVLSNLSYHSLRHSFNSALANAFRRRYGRS